MQPHTMRFPLGLIGWMASLWLLLGTLFVLNAASAYAGGVVGDGTPASCNNAAYTAKMAGGGLVTFNCGSAPIVIPVTTQVINSGVTTTVDGGGLVSLDGGDSLQLFLVQNGGTLNLRNVNLRRGRFLSGGAIYNQTGGTVDLDRVRIENSVAESTLSGNGGGAIYSLGTLRIDRSHIANNEAKRLGGALLVGGTVTVRNTSFIANKATIGGAIWQTNPGTLTLENVSFISNRVDALTSSLPRQGGAIYTFGSLNATNTTFAFNIADTGGGLYAATGSVNAFVNVTMYANRANIGGAIFNESSNITLRNTVAGYTRNRPDTADSLNCDSNGANTTSAGHNVVSDNSCFTAPAAGDQLNVNPQLAGLADNGGPTLTVMPLPGSPVINSGSNCPATDQRGAMRPFGPACDVGAVEFGAHPPVLWLPIIQR